MEKNHAWHLITIGLLGFFASLIMAVYYVPYLRGVIIDSLLHKSGQDASAPARPSSQNTAASVNSNSSK